MTQQVSNNSDNLDRAYELKREVEKWFSSTFNCVRLSVYERIAQNPDPNSTDYASELAEHIRQKPVSNYVWEFLNDLDADKKEEYKTEAEESQADEVSEEDLEEYVADNYEDEIREWADNSGYSENYPLWNTLFELKEEASWVAEAAQEVGLGVIESFDAFNTTLFATSGGHSFYGQYWIPLYLKLYPEEAKEKWAGVEFGMM